MSLTSWIIVYIVDILFFGWLLLRDKELKKEAGVPIILAIVMVVSTIWFIIGLIYPETRFYIYAQPG